MSMNKLKIRASRMVEFYKKYIKKGDNVLDVGCGDGMMAIELRNQLGINFKLTGTDVLKYEPDFIFKQMKEEQELPFKDNTFDVVMLNDVLHHIEHSKQVYLIRECLRVGKIVLIYEVANGFTEKFVDVITNKLHDFRVKIPLTMSSDSEWVRIFDLNNFYYQYDYVPRKLNQYFLLRNYLFMVRKETFK